MNDRPPSFPAVIPGGALVPHLSARYRTQLMDSVMEAAGGFERILAWVEKSDDNFKEFFKLWAKGAARATTLEVNAGSDLSDLIKRLDEEDRASKATLIEGTAVNAIEKESV